MKIGKDKGTEKDKAKKRPGLMSPARYIKGLGLTLPSKKEVARDTLATMAVMLAGGAFLFVIDTATMCLFAISG